MGTIYDRIEELCNKRGITGGKMCNDLGFSRSTMTELRKGRVTTLKGVCSLLRLVRRHNGVDGVLDCHIVIAGRLKPMLPSFRAVPAFALAFACRPCSS